MSGLKLYDCAVCNAPESVETTLSDIEKTPREICANCGYVFEGASDPYEIDENEKIVQMIMQDRKLD
ncbi:MULTISPECIES: hypothetical protein [Bacillus cereus group]|uniref:hypothetical protein n=1 Tax=Bacillus cereus group TaxID=86661 RepID=UPI000BEDCA87|nr:hypothetical protein CON32_00280 [Bacillus cereus]